MMHSILVYCIVVTAFMASLTISGWVLHLRLRLVAGAAGGHIVVITFVTLWAARFDLHWLSPEHIMTSSPWTFFGASAVIFLLLLHTLAHFPLRAAVVVAVLSHFVAMLACDYTILAV